MKWVLDSGALTALERNDRAMWRRFKAAALAGEVAVSHGGVVGQAWRGRGPRQALLAKALIAIDIRPLDGALGRAAGELLAATHRPDVIDAALVLLADDGDRIVTSDADDLEPLAEATGRHVDIVRT
ncbi:MAG: twitching motility protein PilT [Polyangiales bacterium]